MKKKNEMIVNNENELTDVENIYQDIRNKIIIDILSSKLTSEFGSGFSSVSIRRMRRFYEMYPIWSTVSTELSWAHFQELIKIDRKEERDFYENESIKSNWGCRELRRQINTYLPTKEELIKIIKDEKELYELSKEEGEKD